jgi:hypothetical protein
MLFKKKIQFLSIKINEDYSKEKKEKKRKINSHEIHHYHDVA